MQGQALTRGNSGEEVGGKAIQQHTHTQVGTGQQAHDASVPPPRSWHRVKLDASCAWSDEGRSACVHAAAFSSPRRLTSCVPCRHACPATRQTRGETWQWTARERSLG